MRLFMEKYPQLLDVNSVPCRVSRVLAEAASEGLIALLDTMWLDTQLLVEYLISLVQHNVREKRLRVDWAAEYEIPPMHFLFRLTLDFNTCCISVEEEVGVINLPSMSAHCFELYRRTLDKPHILTPSSLSPVTPTPRAPQI